MLPALVWLCLLRDLQKNWDRRDSNPEPKDYESSALTD